VTGNERAVNDNEAAILSLEEALRRLTFARNRFCERSLSENPAVAASRQALSSELMRVMEWIYGLSHWARMTVTNDLNCVAQENAKEAL